MRMRLAAILLALMLGGCASLANYGNIPHANFVENGQCNPQSGGTASAELPFFLVTSRLPDCRTDLIQLTHHRADKVRYGHFAAPSTHLVGKKSILAPLIQFRAEEDWWQGLSRRVSASGGRVLLYVHGYRETPESVTRDAAQIARLTSFDAPVILYSWPSQGSLLGYAVDETNMYWDERNFRRFLMRLAADPGVKDITIVSHSLGARLVIPAIEFADRNSSSADSSNISNIILASPDVDRDDFERDIAEEVLSPRRVANNRRITVYASSNDAALDVSRKLHGYPRLGSPHCFDPFEAKRLKAAGLPVRCYASEKSGLIIVDTSEESRGTSGHSNYLRSASVCRDFAAVVAGKREGAGERRATDKRHVFTLAGPKVSPEEDRAVCRVMGVGD